MRRTLRDEPGRFQLHWVTTLQEGLDHLGKGEVDAVLLDLNLPDSRGVETVVRLRERAPSLPIVVLIRTCVASTSSSSIRSTWIGSRRIVHSFECVARASRQKPGARLFASGAI